MGLTTIYLLCAIAGGVVLVIRMVLMIIGLDHGDAGDFDLSGHLDANLDLNHDGVIDSLEGGSDVQGSFFSFFSIQSIAGFFTMFGLVGLGLLQVNASDIWSLVGALAAGVFTAWCTGMIFMFMRRLQSDGTLKIENAIGQQGTVYLTIPEQGTGSISVTIQGALRTMDAISHNGQKIPTGSIVSVTGVAAGDILIVAEKSVVKEQQVAPSQPPESKALSGN